MGKWIHKISQGQGCRVDAVEDRLLDVRGQQSQAQDTGGVAGAGDALIGGDLLDAAVLAPGQPAVPAMCTDQGVDQRDVRLRVAVGIHRLAGG